MGKNTPLARRYAKSKYGSLCKKQGLQSQMHTFAVKTEAVFFNTIDPKQTVGFSCEIREGSRKI